MTDGASSPDRRERDRSADSPGIEICEQNPYYWAVDGEPTLLVGGSATDNLYQRVGNPDADVEAELDRLVESGGNYVRHTMQSRVNDDEEAAYIVQPFERRADGCYDLDEWNPEYWSRFETVLEWTAERDIVTQVTFWDRFDFADYSNDTWSAYNPWNPQNNVTYTVEESGLPTEWDRHPCVEVFPFMRTLETGNEFLLDYQERYVAKVLDHTLDYDHVLYNVSNETRAPKSWGDHWAMFTHERAAERNAGPAYVTQMYDKWDVTAEMHDRTYDDPDTYDFADVSQNNQESGQTQYDNLTAVRARFADRPWPLNNEKCYGADGGSHGSTREGLQRFWQSIFGGSASIRFHRPPSGLGIGDIARAHIQAARTVTDELDLATTEPRPDLLAERDDAEVYCLSDGSTHLVLFEDGGTVTLDVGVSDSTAVVWYDVERASWASEADADPVVDGETARLSAPDRDYWVAVIRN
jgi:hypothetical protein